MANDLFHAILKQQFPGLESEYRFNSERRYRFDYCWPAAKIALEIEGGVWTGGRHTRGAGFVRDIEKYNSAALIGWRVFRVTPQMVKNGQAIELLEKIFHSEQGASHGRRTRNKR